MSVSLVARRHGMAPNQLFRWRRLYAEGALSAVGAGKSRASMRRRSVLSDRHLEAVRYPDGTHASDL